MSTCHPSYSPELEALLNRAEREIEQGLVPAEIFANDEIFKVEMDRIFTRNWVFVAHESEIPKYGDYVLRRIGLDQVLVTRGKDGEINVISNLCRHRGTRICEADQGNAKLFRCPFHAWIYKNNGERVGAPHGSKAYAKLDNSEWGLLRAPRVELFHGMIFAALSEDVSPLREFLAGAAWMFDACFGLHPKGMRVTGPPDRFRIRSDWKLSGEFGGDNYHVEAAHISVQDIGLVSKLGDLPPNAYLYEMGNGHSFIGHGFTEWFSPEMVLWGYPKEIIDQFDLSKLDDQQRQMITHRPPVTASIFPNFNYLRFIGTYDPDKPPAVYTTLRQWQPVAPGVIELWSWHLTWDFAPDEYTAASYAAAAYNFGSGGIFEEDDTLSWEGPSAAARSPWARKEAMSLNYQLGEGMSEHYVDTEWKGPGIVRKSGFGEQSIVAYYKQWLKEMRRGD